jgi:hypothetical protein
MLAEIFFLQLEATMRANSGVCALRLDYCAPAQRSPAPDCRAAARRVRSRSGSKPSYWFPISFDIALEPAKSRASVFTPLP